MVVLEVRYHADGRRSGIYMERTRGESLNELDGGILAKIIVSRVGTKMV